MRSLRVLVVDDDPVASQVLAEVIRAQGHEVELRAHALGTTAFVLRGGFDVLALDLDMPGLRGEAVGQLVLDCFDGKSERPEIILYSGASDDELQRVAGQLGALGWLQKSIGPAAMAEHFAKLTEGL